MTESDLRAASFVETSPDGRNVYVTSWQVGAITVFDRNEETGALTNREVVRSDDLAGVTDLRISVDGRIVVVSCCHARTAVIFERHPISGRLSRLDVQRKTEDGSDGLYWAIDIALSPDGQFAYVADDRRKGRSSGDSENGDIGRITVLRIEDDGQLEPVQTLLGPDRCLDGIRAVCAHPDGRTIFATCWKAGTLVVLDRDVKTGRLSVRQVLSSKADGPGVLNGAVTAACSPDGQFVYTVSGRFTDDAPNVAINFARAVDNLLVPITIGKDDGLFRIGLPGAGLNAVDFDAVRLQGAGLQPAELSEPTVAQGVGVFRLTSDGKLSTVQTVRTGGQGQIALRGGNQLLVTADCRRLYVSGTTSGTLVGFVRDSSTGRLTHEQTLKYDDSDLKGLNGANGIAESPDGRFLHVTGERAGSVTVLHRVSQE
ncbi:MAG: beta-propeller fold lactonase family protein [Fuerstiella sp.]